MKTTSCAYRLICALVIFTHLTRLNAQNCAIPVEYLPVQGPCKRIIEEEYTYLKGKKTRAYRKEISFNSSGNVEYILRTLENGRMMNTRFLYNEAGKLISWVNYSNEGVSTVSVNWKAKKNVTEMRKTDIDGALINQTVMKFDKDCQLIEEQIIQNEQLVIGKKYEYNAPGLKTKMELLEPDELGRLSKSIMNFYVYLDNGLLWKHYYTAEKLVKHEYRYPSFDSQGNWTVREDFIANKQSKLGKRTSVVTRSIIY